MIRSGGKQYKVSTGDVIEVDKLELGEKTELVIEDVLLTSIGGKVSIGNPVLTNAKVKATLVEQKKGEKIRVMKFKAKSRYRRAIGFRAKLTVLKIDKIETGNDSKSEVKAETTTKTAPKTLKK